MLHTGLVTLPRSIWVALYQTTPAGRSASAIISPRRSWGPKGAEYERVRAMTLLADVLESAACEPAPILVIIAAYLLGRCNPYLGRGERLGRVGIRGLLAGFGSHPTSIGLGLWGQFAPEWSSQRLCGHRGTTLARPVNASL